MATTLLAALIVWSSLTALVFILRVAVYHLVRANGRKHLRLRHRNARHLSSRPGPNR